MHQNVARIRELLRDAVPCSESDQNSEAALQKRWEYYEFNVGLPVVEQTYRARALREINRIAAWYGFTSEIVRALDREHASSLVDVSDDAVDRLLERMTSLESGVQTGCDSPEAPPAR